MSTHSASPFIPPLGLASRHVQTVRNRLRPKAFDLLSLGEQRSVLVPMTDGSGDVLATWIHTSSQHNPAFERPLVVLIHGLGGTSESVYIRATTWGLLRAGYHVARVDLRGAGRSVPYCVGLYHAGRTSDLRRVLYRLSDEPQAQVAGESRLSLVGFSLGGNMVIKFLGESNPDVPIVSAATVSAPLDLVRGSEFLQRSGFGIYERALVAGLKRQLRSPGPAGPRISESESRALAGVRTLPEFDDVITAPRNGWRNAQEYYRLNSSQQFVSDISTPTLLIHSLDDPMVVAQPYVQLREQAQNKNLSIVLTRGGGHVGFHHVSAPTPWYVQRLIGFLDQH